MRADRGLSITGEKGYFVREPEKITAEMVRSESKKSGLSYSQARRELQREALMRYVRNIGTSGEFNSLDEIKLVLLKLIEGG